MAQSCVSGVAMTDWFHFKLLLIDHSGLSRDALHICLGVLVQLAVAALPRQSFARLWPWLAVLVTAMGNEWYDLNYETWPDRNEQRLESVKDLIATMAIPTMLLFIARFAPQLFTGRGSPPPASQSDSGGCA
jgi:hypothetical protein